MQQTKSAPQPDDSEIQNPQNDSNRNTTYESTPVFSDVSTDSNCFLID